MSYSREPKLESGRYIRRAVIATGGALALAACSSGSSHEMEPSASTCKPLATILGSVLQRQIIDHKAPKTFTDPVKSPDLKTVVFGLPKAALQPELEHDQAVIAGVHSYVDKVHRIQVVVNKTPEIHVGVVGIALYSGSGCPTIMPSGIPEVESKLLKPVHKCSPR